MFLIPPWRDSNSRTFIRRGITRGVCPSRLDGFRFGADISGYRTITGAALVGTSSRSGCTGASEAPSAYLPFSRNAGAGGETDSAMRRCVPRPNAISPTRCHVPCCALRAAAICDARAKRGICGRARKFQLLGAIACDLVHSKLHNMCRLQQSPAVAVELPRHFFQPGAATQARKRSAKSPRAVGLLGSRSVFSIAEAGFRLATFSALTDFVSWVEPR